MPGVTAKTSGRYCRIFGPHPPTTLIAPKAHTQTTAPKAHVQTTKAHVQTTTAPNRTLLKPASEATKRKRTRKIPSALYYRKNNGAQKPARTQFSSPTCREEGERTDESTSRRVVESTGRRVVESSVAVSSLRETPTPSRLGNGEQQGL